MTTNLRAALLLHLMLAACVALAQTDLAPEAEAEEIPSTTLPPSTGTPHANSLGADVKPELAAAPSEGAQSEEPVRSWIQELGDSFSGQDFVIAVVEIVTGGLILAVMAWIAKRTIRGESTRPLPQSPAPNPNSPQASIFVYAEDEEIKGKFHLQGHFAGSHDAERQHSPQMQQAREAWGLQRQDRRREAIEKWEPLAELPPEGSDQEVKKAALLSLSYLYWQEASEANADERTVLLQKSLEASSRILDFAPDSADAYCNRGNTLSELGRDQEAIADHDQAIKIKPDLVEAYSNRGAAKARLKRFEEAILDFEHALQLHPNASYVYCNRGLAKVGLARLHEAISDFQLAIQLGRAEQDPRVYAHLGNALADAGKFEEAIAAYNNLLALEPSSAEALGWRGDAKSHLKQYEEAISDFDQALKLRADAAYLYCKRAFAKIGLARFHEAIDDCNQAIELGWAERDPEIYGVIGDTWTSLGEYKKALSAYTSWSALKPNEARGHNKLGTTNTHLKRFEEAVLDFDRALELDPNVGYTYCNRAFVKILLGQFQGAIVDCNRAIALGGAELPSKVYRLLGDARVALGEHGAAIAAYDSFLEMEPNCTDVYNIRGAEKVHLGRYEEAILDYDRALELEPDNASFYHNRAGPKILLERFREAIEDCNHALALGGVRRNQEIYRNLGLARLHLGENREAVAAYNRLLTLKPDDAEAYNNRGLAKVHLGRYEEAIADFKHTLELSPDSANAHCNLGLASRGLGETARAIEYMGLAIALGERQGDFEGMKTASAAREYLAEWEREGSS